MCWHCEKAKHIFFLTLEQSSFLLIIMFSCKDVQKIPKVFHLHMENWVGHTELGRCFMIEAHWEMMKVFLNLGLEFGLKLFLNLKAKYT